MEDPAEPEKEGDQTGTPTDVLGAALSAMGSNADPEKLMESLPQLMGAVGGIQKEFDQIKRIVFGNALLLEKIGRLSGLSEEDLEVYGGVEPIG